MTATDNLIPLLTAGISNLHLERIEQVQGQIIARITSLQSSSRCPTCGTISSHLHSHYTRMLQDLPISGSSVTWFLLVRRFRCVKKRCKQHIFCERFDHELFPYARNTKRTNTLLEETSLSIGASCGSKLVPKHGLNSSAATMLRRAHQAVIPVEANQIKIIGVDDFAFKRGRTYGTIIVNHETGRVLDLLADRSSATLSTWLKQYPSIKVITRDRSLEYSKGCSEGAPQATQVLDRWHLLKNLRDALEHFLERHSKVIAELAKQFKSALDIPLYKRSPQQLLAAQVAIELRRERILKIRSLHSEGQTIAEIAFELMASRTFVRKAIVSDGLPEIRRNARTRSVLTPWLEALETRFKAGLRNARQFWRELQALGFTGSYERVHDWVRFRRDVEESQTKTMALVEPPKTLNQIALELSKFRSFAVRQLVWLLLLPLAELSEDDQKVLTALEKSIGGVTQARELALEFRRLLLEKDVKALESWLSRVKSSGLPDLVSFVTYLERERVPLEAAITEVWSNGRTEGHVNRLKLIKRQGYGKAGFNLLRKRVLLA